MKRSPDSHKAALWQQRMADFQASSMTVAEYCKSVACSVAGFYQWRRKLSPSQSPIASSCSSSPTSTRRSAGDSPRRRARQTTAFLPVELSSATLSSALRCSAVVVTLTNGTRLELACDPHHALQSILQQSMAGMAGQ